MSNARQELNSEQLADFHKREAMCLEVGLHGPAETIHQAIEIIESLQVANRNLRNALYRVERDGGSSHEHLRALARKALEMTIEEVTDEQMERIRAAGSSDPIIPKLLRKADELLAERDEALAEVERLRAELKKTTPPGSVLLALLHEQERRL